MISPGPLLVIIRGPQGSGKTLLAKHIQDTVDNVEFHDESPTYQLPHHGVRVETTFDVVSPVTADVARLETQLEIAVEALLQYSTSSTSGDRAREALATISSLDEGEAS